MDRTRRCSTELLRWVIWRPTMGFHSKSFRFEGGGRQRILGLKRTGKSCRLRWVNYLHPSLKRGKMTTQEERLVLELHSKWGNRWSKIARKLPGRTDNEIKNYWRTHMRKKAQETKKAMIMPNSSSQSSLSSSSSSSSSTSDTVALQMFKASGNKAKNHEKEIPEFFSMDEIWKDIEISEDNHTIKPVYDSFNEEGNSFSCTTMASPIWDYCPDTLWTMIQDEDSKMFMPTIDQFDSNHSQENLFVI